MQEFAREIRGYSIFYLACYQDYGDYVEVAQAQQPYVEKQLRLSRVPSPKLPEDKCEQTENKQVEDNFLYFPSLLS